MFKFKAIFLKLMFCLLLILAIVFSQSFLPVVQATSLASAKDTLSNSDSGATGVAHAIVFKSGVDLTAGTMITVTFNDAFGGIDVGNFTCPLHGIQNGEYQFVSCTVVDTLASNTPYTLSIVDTINPATTGDYDITVEHDQSGHPEISQILVYVTDQVNFSAHINASLIFSIATTSANFDVNGTLTTGTSSPSAINFSTLQPGPVGRQFIAQSLSVETNASTGYVVTVEQDHDLTNAANADINAYAIVTKAGWVSPAGTLADKDTYGHFALTSTDEDDYDDAFGFNEYQGFNGTDPLPVMGHTGVADGLTPGIGQAYVGYSIEITDLQEAGDYSNALTYVCTPEY